MFYLAAGGPAFPAKFLRALPATPSASAALMRPGQSQHQSIQHQFRSESPGSHPACWAPYTHTELVLYTVHLLHSLDCPRCPLVS